MNIQEKLSFCLNEGTGSTPNTIKKAKQLERLFKRPIELRFAKDDLYNYIGDDLFFDQLNDTFRGSDKMEDVRWFVADGIGKNGLKDINRINWKVEGEPKAIEILQKIVKKKY